MTSGVTGSALRDWVRLVPPLAYFLGLIAWEIWAVDWGDLLAIELSLLTVAYLLLIVSTYLRRGPSAPLRRGDWFSQIIAFVGANMLVPLSQLPIPVQNPGLEVAAVMAAFVGLAFSFWAVWHLGTAFSIVPEARKLVETGPYQWIRHPLYLAGFVIGLGLLGVKFSPAAIGFFLAFAVSQGLRMVYEERVLSEALPQYREYRQRTWALVPYIL